MKGYVARKGNRWYAVIYHGLDLVTGRDNAPDTPLEPMSEATSENAS